MKTLHLKAEKLISLLQQNKQENFEALKIQELDDAQFKVILELLEEKNLLAKIIVLDLSYNQNLKTLPASIGKCLALQTLDLRFTPAAMLVPLSLGNCTALEEIPGCKRVKTTYQLPYSKNNVERLKFQWRHFQDDYRDDCKVRAEIDRAMQCINAPLKEIIFSYYRESDCWDLPPDLFRILAESVEKQESQKQPFKVKTS